MQEQNPIEKKEEIQKPKPKMVTGGVTSIGGGRAADLNIDLGGE